MTIKELNAVTALYQSYAEKNPDVVPRDSQFQMMGTVAETLLCAISDAGGARDRATVAVIEGPTGTGKTLAYLMAALPIAMAHARPLVLSTATVALQEQLFERDLPSLLAAMGKKPKVVLAKGRRRFVCLSRLEASAAPTDTGEPLSPTFVRFADAFKQGDWDGDRDNWCGEIDDGTWAKVSTDANGCVGHQCSHFEQCPFYSARAEIEDASVIVANHDLVISNYRYAADVLPAQRDALFVFDEAHHLPSKVLSHAAQSFGLRAAAQLAKKSERLLAQAEEIVSKRAPFSSTERKNWRQAARRIGESVEALHLMCLNAAPLKKSQRDGDALVWRFQFGRVPAQIVAAGKNIFAAVEVIQETMVNALGKTREVVEPDHCAEGSTEELLRQLGESAGKLDELANAWRLLIDDPAFSQIPMARWIERLEVGQDVEFLVSASPITAAPVLNEMLWRHATGIVLASATLTALGDFNRFAEKTGLNAVPNVLYLGLPSPFDYSRNATLEIPVMSSDPRDADAHTEEIVAWVNENIDPNGSTLLLFTSHRQMQTVRSALSPALDEVATMQNSGSKKQLIDAHIAKIDAGFGSLLLGTDSLAEGLDLPGNYLTHVVIAKLPFGVPVSPVYEALAEWLASTGRNPFLEVSVPDASQKLAQAVGRLIRSETDCGRVSILDRRLLTMRYGPTLLASLPDMQRAEVQAANAESM